MTFTDETQERIRRLREQAEKGHPDAWRPEKEGDEVSGFYVRLDGPVPTRFGDAWIVILDEGGLERAVWLLHTALRNEFRKIRPIPGELVYVRYDGKKDPGTGGAMYDAYTVKVDRKPGGDRWDAVGTDVIASRVVNEQLVDQSHPDDDIPF